MTKQAVLFLILLLGAFDCHATFQTGNELLEECESSSPIFCMGYIAAVIDARDRADGAAFVYFLDEIACKECREADSLEGHQCRSFVEKCNIEFCIPEGVTLGQLRRVVIKHLNSNPASLHRTAASLVQNAILESYGCP